jgi:hypothetical protein
MGLWPSPIFIPRLPDGVTPRHYVVEVRGGGSAPIDKRYLAIPELWATRLRETEGGPRGPELVPESPTEGLNECEKAMVRRYGVFRSRKVRLVKLEIWQWQPGENSLDLAATMVLGMRFATVFGIV